MAIAADSGNPRQHRPNKPWLTPLYRAYIASPQWAAKRQAKLVDVGRQCQRCGSNENLEVHHRTYVRLGCEELYDLEVLCEPCHERVHKTVAIEALFNGWARRRYGDRWDEGLIDYDRAADEYDAWLDRWR